MKKIKKFFSKKVVIIILVVLIIAAAVGVVIVKKKQSEAKTATQTFVRTVTLSYGSLDNTVVADGTISSQNTSTITSSAENAQVKAINVEVGDYVEEGDVIIELDTESIEKNIERAEKSVDDQQQALYDAYGDADDAYDESLYNYYKDKSSRDDAIKKYNDAITTLSGYQSAYDAATKALNDEVEYLKNQGYTFESGSYVAKKGSETYDCTSLVTAQATAKKNLDDAKTQLNFTTLENNYKTATSNEESLLKSIKSADDKLDDASENIDDGVNTDNLDDLKEKLEDYSLKARSSGQVTAVNTTVGQIANGTLVTIQDTSNLTVTVSIDEYDISSIKVGQKAKITTDAVDGEFEGEVVSISPVASAATGGGMMAASTSSSFDVKINITSDTTGLLIGMSCEVTIYLSTTEDVLTVPVSAIETIDDKTYIYVQNSNGEFVQTEVSTGETTGYYTEVYGDNIKEGDVVRFSYNEDEAEVEADISDMAGGFDFGGGGGGMPSGGGNGGGGGMPSGGGAPGGGF